MLLKKSVLFFLGIAVLTLLSRAILYKEGIIQLNILESFSLLILNIFAVSLVFLYFKSAKTEKNYRTALIYLVMSICVPLAYFVSLKIDFLSYQREKFFFLIIFRALFASSFGLISVALAVSFFRHNLSFIGLIFGTYFLVTGAALFTSYFLIDALIGTLRYF